MKASFRLLDRRNVAELSAHRRIKADEKGSVVPSEVFVESIPSFLLTSEPAASAAERAYRRLEEAIVTMELPPGTTVSEAFLGQLSGFGRSAVREAVRRLSFERLLIVKPKRGIYVTEIDPLAQLRLLEVRREIDCLLFRSAARRATLQQRTIFATLGEDFRDSATGADELLFIRADKVFNELCLVSARNEFTADSLLVIQGLSRRFWFRYFRHVDMLGASAILHANVATAIAEGDLLQVAIAANLLSVSAEGFARRIAEDKILPEDIQTLF